MRIHPVRAVKRNEVRGERRIYSDTGTTAVLLVHRRLLFDKDTDVL